MTSGELKINKLKTLHLFPLAHCCLLLAAVFILASCSTPRRVVTYKQTYPEPGSLESKYMVASWYGSDFHGRPTSSGEIYNMYAKTCAHKEYPFGTKLKVTNTANSRSTDCVVNDRGPFVRGRDIDLSYACAREIGLIGTGTGNVKIDYLGRDMGYIKEVKYSDSGKGPVTIQVGSFKEPANASRLKNALEFKYDRVYVIDAEIGGSIYYRVRIGKFSSREDADILAETLAEEGYSALIIRYDERI